VERRLESFFKKLLQNQIEMGESFLNPRNEEAQQIEYAKQREREEEEEARLLEEAEKLQKELRELSRANQTNRTEAQEIANLGFKSIDVESLVASSTRAPFEITDHTNVRPCSPFPHMRERSFHSMLHPPYADRGAGRTSRVKGRDRVVLWPIATHSSQTGRRGCLQ